MGITGMADFRIKAEWDAYPGVWVATSPDIPGLCIQARVPHEIIEKIRLILPALIEIGTEPEDRLLVTLQKAESRGLAVLPIAQSGERGVDPRRKSGAR